MPAKRRHSETDPPPRRRRRATTVEGREQQLVSDAIDLAEKQIREGTASSQVITHFLKLGSTREQLEQERLAHENELTQVRIESVRAQARMEELYSDAIRAMRSYGGNPEPEEPEFDEEL